MEIWTNINQSLQRSLNRDFYDLKDCADKLNNHDFRGKKLIDQKTCSIIAFCRRMNAYIKVI